MKMKNKELKKLFDVVEPYYDMVSLPSVMTSFMACDDAIEDEIAALKAELTDANRYKDIYRNSSDSLRSAMFERYDELRKANNQIDELKEKLNNERKHGEDLADVNGKLASENADLKANTSRLILLENSRTAWRIRAQHAEKTITDLNKKIHELEQETADDAIRIKSLERANSILRGDNKTLWSRLEEADIPEHHKRPWHCDANAMTGGRTCCKSLTAAIEFQNKKQENVDMSYGHEFEFGDEVFVTWSDEPYMYVSTSLLYNPRTERLVYVGKDQHLKWFGEKFLIV